MPTKQQELYNQIKQETEIKIQTYNDFQKQIDNIRASAKERISSLKADMKVVAKQIKDNNKLLAERKVETIPFKEVSND